MKTHRLLISFLAGLCAAALFCACNDDPDPNEKPIPPTPPTPEALENAYEFDGVKSEIASVAQAWIDGSEYVFLTPEKNMSNAEELIASDKERVMFVFHDGIDTKQTDLTAEGVDVYYYGSGGKLLFEASGTNRSALVSGTLSGKEAGDQTGVFDFSITLVSEKTFRGNFKASLAVAPPVVPENRVSIDDNTIEMKSVFVETMDGYKVFNMTPTAGVTSFDQIMENDYDCFQVSIESALLNTTFDVVKETRDFEISSMFKVSELMIGPGYTEGVESGSCLFSIEGTLATLSVDLVLENGSKLTAVGSCEVAPEPELTQYISVNGVKTPVGSAFFEPMPESYVLYFTPTQIELFSQLPETDYAFIFEFGLDLIDGTEYDITAITEQLFSFEYWIFKEDKSVRIATGELNGATGTISVNQDMEFEEAFTIELHLMLSDGTTYDLKFDDVCLSTAEEEETANEYVFNGNSVPINSVIVDQSNAEIHDIWLCGAHGITTIQAMQEYSPMKISVPATGFDGQEMFFQVVPECAITFGPYTYNAVNGNTGSIRAQLVESVLTLDFMVDQALTGHYADPVVIIPGN